MSLLARREVSLKMAIRRKIGFEMLASDQKLSRAQTMELAILMSNMCALAQYAIDAVPQAVPILRKLELDPAIVDYIESGPRAEIIPQDTTRFTCDLNRNPWSKITPSSLTSICGVTGVPPIHRAVGGSGLSRWFREKWMSDVFSGSNAAPDCAAHWSALGITSFCRRAVLASADDPTTQWV
ncbi:hypothetical protein BBP40_004058 [Aspergillus hancockii]|nr:hypothetical protein BBP40_004058 [Aspergillus hancockii]